MKHPARVPRNLVRRPAPRLIVLALVGIAGVSLTVHTAAEPAHAGKTKKVVPRVVCASATGASATRRVRPSQCVFVDSRSDSTRSQRMIGLRWSRWGSRTATGRGAAFREWPSVRVSLSRAVTSRGCHGKSFTRAKFTFLDEQGRAIKAKTFRMPPCGLDFN